MISKEKLEEFKKIHKKEFDEELSDEDALEKATNFYRLVELILDDYIKERISSEDFK